MGAEDPTRLGGGNLIPSRESDGTLQDLADRAATLASTLDTFAAVLAESHSGRFAVVPAIYQAIQGISDPAKTIQEIRALTASYREHLDWMGEILGVEPRPVTALTPETKSRKRLIDRPISLNTNMSSVPPEELAALGLFHWVAEWIRETMPSSRPGKVNGGYWPPLSGEGLAVAADRAGDLTPIPPQKVAVTLDGFVATDHVSQNGWPDPIAVADHFRYAIEREDRPAKRQLEMLLAGLVTGHLRLREIPEPGEAPERISLAALVRASRETGFPDLARYAVVYPEEENEVMGFTSPHTLLCAKPPTGQPAPRIWGSLWKKITGSDQQENWATVESPRVWGHADRAVRQILSWLGHLRDRYPGTPPAWTRIFDRQAESAPIEYGVDRETLSVYWSSTDHLVSVALPTAKSGDYWPDPETPLIPEDELLKEVPELSMFPGESGSMLFEMVTFDVPGRDRPVRAVWKEHLDRLQQHGHIAGFGSKEDDVSIWMRDRVHAAILKRMCILDRDVMMVKRCSPMRQDPVPGSSTRIGATLYPDLPLRSEYLGLVQTDAGETVLDLLKKGDTSFPNEFGPAIDDTHGGRSATWTLRLKGRQEPLTILLPVAPESDHHQAHWMVWPRFRSSGDQSWRAYYVYEHCTDARLRLETLWLDPESDRVRRCAVAKRSGSHPISFATGQRRAHTGGPPVAFSVRHTVSEEEIGLYLIQLTPLSPNDKDLKIGIDFGTSHTVASFLTGGDRSVVGLDPELDPANAETALTLHVSEDWPHVAASFHQDGLSALGGWLPNYVQSVAPDARGLLPSELLTIRPLDRLNADEVAEWQPGRDCVIPFMDMQRPDIADHILADFKWEASFPAFRGREPVLREIYLGQVIELVMADVVWRRRALPGQPVDFTFTYPLRTQRSELSSFEETLRRLLENSSRSLGCKLTLRDDTGTYNESRAAKGGAGNFGEVSLVGDLGGGTLDLFISANALPGVEFEEVADSARLGGNLLLRTLARNPQRFLPANAGWKFDDSERLATQLRAWMRSKGSRGLFGAGAGERGKRTEHEGLEVQGFDQPAQADPARRLINRYFRLIAEYMARSLVAFLARDWYRHAPTHHHDKLQILVQLRGNGWRLWHDAVQYRRIEEEIRGWIEDRARVLWQDPNLWKLTPPPGPPDGNWARHTGDANPKTAPILAAVGQAESPQDAERFKSHTLVQLDLLHAGSSPDPVPWFSSNRFKTGGKTTQVEFNAIEPPLPLSPHDVETSIDDFDDQLKAEVNRKLREEGSFPNEVEFRAPVAPIVWEAAFKCRQFLGND